MTTVVRMTEIVESQHYLFFVTELKYGVFFCMKLKLSVAMRCTLK